MGTNVPRKRFALLAAACELLPEARLVLAGDGTEVFDDPSGRIAGLGRVSEDKLLDLYDTASLYAMPSTYEGYGLPAVEAWQRGCRLLISRAVASKLPDAVVREATIVGIDVDAPELARAIDAALTAPHTPAASAMDPPPQLLSLLSERLAAIA